MLALALLLLAVFAGATLAAQWWLGQETKRLKEEAVETQRRVLDKALTMNPRPSPEAWDEDYLRDLGALVGGRVEVVDPANTKLPEPVDAGATLTFDYALPDAPGWRAHVSFGTPALVRLQRLQQSTLAATVVLALVLVAVPSVFVLVGLRRMAPAATASGSPWREARADALGLEHFARMSVERGVALDRESGARQRAEEDLKLSRTLLHRSQEERIRLGRDLHDNICQTLYAVSLTLESVRKKMTAAPECESRLDQCMQELRRLNQEVRAYLKELEPDATRGPSFAEILDQMLATLPAEEGVHIVRHASDETLALIRPDQAADVVNILREAISNGLRHGQARNISLRAERGDNAIALAVQDDGKGFEGTGNHGHGLANMQARTEILGGSLRVDSTPGKGTRVLLTLPVASAS
ncbi:MAG: sensor histidine kinase [Opitutaceae bacterium]|nr:sensor histidine kinase [Opitutaceae bacterium]